MINEDSVSYVPKYVQIQKFILQKIEEGVFLAGDKIPSEAELSRQFEVSRITVSTAIKELAGSGVVERIQGKGTFVRSSAIGEGGQPMAFAGGIKMAPLDGSVRKPHRLMEHGIIQAGPGLCAKLGLEQDSYVYRMARRVPGERQADELDYSYIPLSVCSGHTFDCEDLECVFLHDYIFKYFDEKPTHIKIFINTQATEDMDAALFPGESRERVFIWDTYVFKEKKVLAVTTTICVPQDNKPFITLEL